MLSVFILVYANKAWNEVLLSQISILCISVLVKPAIVFKASIIYDTKRIYMNIMIISQFLRKSGANTESW